MNTVTFKIKTVAHDVEVIIDGLKLSGVQYLLAYVDNQNIIESDHSFYGSFIVWEELKKSSLNSGEYLIFTSVSGVADDAGWNYVKVKHDAATISWTFYVNDNILHWIFDRQSYLNQIGALSNLLVAQAEDYFLEPRFVIYPEGD